MLMRNQLQQESTKKKEKEFQEQEVLGIKYEVERKLELLKEEARSRKEERKCIEAKSAAVEPGPFGSPPKSIPKEGSEASLIRSRESRRSSSLRRQTYLECLGYILEII